MTKREEISALEDAVFMNKDDLYFQIDPSKRKIYEAARAHLEQLRAAPVVKVLEIKCCSECGTIYTSNKIEGANNG